MNRALRRRGERNAAEQSFLLRVAASASIVGILMAVLSLVSTATAQAHAYIVSTQPAANGSFESPAGSVAITFDEPIDILDANAIFVTDSHGKRVDKRDASIDPNDATRVIVHVPKDLIRGAYTVHWRVVSADTHVVHGLYQIGVGVAVTPSSVTDPDSPFDPSNEAASILRGLTLLGALMIGGAMLMQSTVLRRLEPIYRGVTEPARMVTIAGAVLVLVFAVPALLVQGAAASGSMGGGVAATLTTTLWGHAFLVRVALAIALLALALRGRSGPKAWGFAASAALLATFGATSHALDPHSALARAIAESADLIHLLAAAVWIGGIMTLGVVYAFHQMEDAGRGELARSLFAHFTPIARVCVAAIALTGVYAALIHLQTIGDLVSTNYGLLLLAKIALVAVMLGLGYVHLRAGLRAEKVRSMRSFALEISVGVVVVFVTAFLIGQMPPTKTSVVSTVPFNQTEFQ